MSSAWFGLIGVVVGGLITTIWSWLSVIRQELSEAVVAARLVDDDLQAAQLPDASVGTSRRTDPAVWSANRVALAKALGQNQWQAVAVVYRSGVSADAAHELADKQLHAARCALAPFAENKRHAVLQRLHNMFSGE